MVDIMNEPVSVLTTEVARLRARVAELEFIVRCPECGGEGETIVDVVRRGTEHDTEAVKCRTCKGTGTCQDMIAEVARLKLELIAQATPSEQAGRVAVAEAAVVTAAEQWVDAVIALGRQQRAEVEAGNVVHDTVDALRAARARKGGG